MTKSVIQYVCNQEKRGEQNVQIYQWCGCPLCGTVCGGCDYGKYVKKG